MIVAAGGINNSILVVVLASAVLYGTPLLFAGLGELLAERSGVLNLGVEGVMLLGAFFAYWTALETDNLWLAVGVSAAVGLVMGVLYAVVTLGFKAEQGEQRYNNSAPKGTVLEQSLPPGTREGLGGTITLVVSGGQRMVTVPTVTGMTRIEAQVLLEGLHGRIVPNPRLTLPGAGGYTRPSPCMDNP